MLYDILERRSVFLGYENKKFKKPKNWDFSQGVNPWFSPKYGFFLSFFFLGNIGQENVFYDILERKTVGLTHGFGPKMAIFPTFFFGNLSQENVFYDIRERRSVFLDYENKKFKKPKNWDFSKWVNPWFWPKNGFFPTLFFNNIRKENVLYDILKRKDVFLGYENKKFKKLKNLAFSKGINQWFWCKNSHFSNFFF